MKPKQDKEASIDNLKYQQNANRLSQEINNSRNVIKQTIIINSSNFNIHCNQKQQNNLSSTTADTRNSNQTKQQSINDSDRSNNNIPSQFFPPQFTPLHHQNIRSKSSNNAFKGSAVTTSKHSRQNQPVISPFKNTSPKPQTLSILSKRQKSTPNSNILNLNNQAFFSQADNSTETDINKGGVRRSQSPVPALSDKQKITINDAKISELKDKQILRQVDNLQKHENQANQLEFNSFQAYPFNNDNNITFNPSNFNQRFTLKKTPQFSEILSQQTQHLSNSNKNIKGCSNVGPSFDILLQKLANSKTINEEKNDSTKTKTYHRLSQKQQPREIQVYPQQPYQQFQIKNKQNEQLTNNYRINTVSSDTHIGQNQNTNTNPPTTNQIKQINPEKSLLRSILNNQSTTPNPANNPIIRFKNNTIDVNTEQTNKIRTTSSGNRKQSPTFIPRSNSQNARRPDFLQQQQHRQLEKQQHPLFQQQQQQYWKQIELNEVSKNNKLGQPLNSIISPYLNPRTVVAQNSKKRIINMNKIDQPVFGGRTLPMQSEPQNTNFNDIMKIYNDTNLSKFTGNTKLHRRYKSNIRGTEVRAKTEMDYEDNAEDHADANSLSESINILNQFNDLDAQASSKQLLPSQDKDSTKISSNTPRHFMDISKTIDESVKLYLNESDLVTSSGIRTQQDLENFMKSGLKIAQKDKQTQKNQQKLTSHVQQQNSNQAQAQRKHSTSVYSVLKENHNYPKTNTSKIKDYLYEFDLEE